MQCLEVSGAVRLIYRSLGVKVINTSWCPDASVRNTVHYYEKPFYLHYQEIMPQEFSDCGGRTRVRYMVLSFEMTPLGCRENFYICSVHEQHTAHLPCV